ncbi:hypothetical protein [Microbacterium sp. CJ77]|uniref:restriction endonuclease subunit S n=1 Tax=Microbacterium sp. CJ77 TaxID=2079201 RepID=UPI0011AF169B|nr:hypothetical protein [Microbacterium sp. CJ77]
MIEQQRIVDMIEDQFSRLDAAERGLDVVIARTASLVQRALADASFGAELVPLADLAAIQSGIQKQPKRRPSRNTAPFLRVANITASGLDLAELHEVEMFAGDQERYQLLLGDLLVVEGNGSANQIGRAALWDNSVPGAVHQNHLIRVRPGPRLLPAYLEAVWNAPQLRRQLSSVASSSSGLYTLSVRKLSALGIPVPSRAHQAEVVQRIALVREVAGRLRAEVMAAQHRSKLLRRAVLAYAFSGQLTGATFDAARIEESLAAQ